MSPVNAFARAVAGDFQRSALTVLCILTAAAWGAVAWHRSQKPIPVLVVGVGSGPSAAAAERYGTSDRAVFDAVEAARIVPIMGPY